MPAKYKCEMSADWSLTNLRYPPLSKLRSQAKYDIVTLATTVARFLNHGASGAPEQ